MGTLLRLDSISPSLTKAFRDASDDRRRRAALAVCLVAVAQSGLQGSEVDAALADLRGQRSERTELRHEIEAMAAQLDERYFELSEKAQAATPEALAMFRKARAAASLAFALSDDTTQLHEALYEAITASRDQAETLRTAEKVLVS
jgi:hypothetical protein